MSKAVVYVADGLEECEGLLVVDLLRRAGTEVIMASVMGRKEIVSSRKIIFCADALAEETELSDVDLLVLPGGLLGTAHLMKNELVRENCRIMAERKLVAAVCAAPTVFASIGLLEGRRATCHPSKEGEMCGAILTHEAVTVDGNLITGRGLGATIPFSLKLAELLEGKEAADRVSTAICWDYTF